MENNETIKRLMEIQNTIEWAEVGSRESLNKAGKEIQQLIDDLVGGKEE
jgi:hypothetical protein